MIAPLEEVQDIELENEEPDSEWVYGLPEARDPKTLPEPYLPTVRERAQHNLTHAPYRSWCDICV